MHSQRFSMPADQQHSPAWKRQPFRICRHRQLHLSAKYGLHSEAQRHSISILNFLKICLQNGPCFYAQRFVFDQIIRILALLNCRFQCSLYCIFCCSELLMPLGQQPVSAVSVNAPPKSKTARLEIFLMVKHTSFLILSFTVGVSPFSCNTFFSPGSICIHAGFNPFRAHCEK